MKHKPIRIDWEELEDAFNSPPEEITSYLDGITGHVVLEGEGEEDDLEDENPLDAASAPPRSDPTRISIRPPGAAEKIEWMRSFLEQEGHEEGVVAELRQALEDENPPQVLADVLNLHADVRDDWYLYRTARIRDMLEEWLASNEVEPLTAPPWKD